MKKWVVIAAMVLAVLVGVYWWVNLKNRVMIEVPDSYAGRVNHLRISDEDKSWYEFYLNHILRIGSNGVKAVDNRVTNGKEYTMVYPKEVMVVLSPNSLGENPVAGLGRVIKDAIWLRVNDDYATLMVYFNPDDIEDGVVRPETVGEYILDAMDRGVGKAEVKPSEGVWRRIKVIIAQRKQWQIGEL